MNEIKQMAGNESITYAKIKTYSFHKLNALIHHQNFYLKVLIGELMHEFQERMNQLSGMQASYVSIRLINSGIIH